METLLFLSLAVREEQNAAWTVLFIEIAASIIRCTTIPTRPPTFVPLTCALPRPRLASEGERRGNCLNSVHLSVGALWSTHPHIVVTRLPNSCPTRNRVANQ